MVITDARLGRMSGYDFSGHVAESSGRICRADDHAYATPKLAVEAIKAGAIDYLAKPFAPEELLHAVGRCAERLPAACRKMPRLRARAGETYRLEQIVGESPQNAGTAAADPNRRAQPMPRF